MKYNECNHVELKQILTKDYNFEEEVVSFLNSEEGGAIYIGIDNHEIPVGLSDPDSVQLQVKDRIKK